MIKTRSDLLKGTLDLLVLRILSTEKRHGYDIAKRIQLVSQDVLKVGQGSLYPSLHRLEMQGKVKADWGETKTGRRARFYELTVEGRKRVEAEVAGWRQFAGAVHRILETG